MCMIWMGVERGGDRDEHNACMMHYGKGLSHCLSANVFGSVPGSLDLISDGGDAVRQRLGFKRFR